MAWSRCSCPWPPRGQVCSCIQAHLRTHFSCSRCGRPPQASGDVCPCQSGECRHCGLSTEEFDPLMACQCPTPLLGVPPWVAVHGSPSGGGSPSGSPDAQGSYKGPGGLESSRGGSGTGGRAAGPAPPSSLGSPDGSSPERRGLSFSFAALRPASTSGGGPQFLFSPH